jgi:hypothetical protein
MIALFAAIFAGCGNGALSSRSIAPHASHSSWKNIYRNDARLAGIEVRQYSSKNTGTASLDDYNGKHPAETNYYFWDGYLEQYLFSPSGSVISKEMSKAPVPAGSKELDFIDFSYGSDPTFAHHPDPRRIVKKWVNLYGNVSSLAGIVINQRPREGCVYEDWSLYDGRHPHHTDYYFWDGRQRYISYTAYGDVQSDEWLKDKIKPGDPAWEDVDFSYGSDPKFQTHKDPRKK